MKSLVAPHAWQCVPKFNSALRSVLALFEGSYV